MKKRILSLLMVICMLISLFPASVLAEEPEINPEDLQLEDVFLDEQDFQEELLSEEADDYPEEPEEAEEPGVEEPEEPGTEENNTEETEPADPSEEPADVTTPSKEQEEPAEEEEAEPTEEPETEKTEGDDEEKEVTIQAASGTCGDNLTWTLDGEGTLTVSGTGAMWDWHPVYPDYNYIPWYDYHESIKKAVLANGVTSIGGYAFYYCRSLTSINIPNSVTSIGDSAFSHCDSLTSINIPNSVTFIGGWAFNDCDGLTSINITDGVTYIAAGAFSGCSSLTSINIPNSVTSIDSWAFDECDSLTSINIPDGVTSIGDSAFRNCISLTSINIPDGVTSIGIHAFYGCSSLTSIDIPNSITSIIESAFYNCSSLTSINIPNGVTSIGGCAFYNCISLTSINIPNSVTSIGDSAFSHCDSLTSINIPNGVTSIGYNTFGNCSSLTSINIPNNVKSIGDFAFGNCSSLSTINFCHNELDELYLGGGCFSLDNNTVQKQTTIGVTDPNHINSAIAEYDWAGDKRNVSFVKYESGSSINHSGVLKEGDGWKLNWECYGDDPADLTLEISLTGSAPTEKPITVEGSPWLDEEYSIKKEDITKIIICGTERNRLDIGAEAFKDYTGVKTLMLGCINAIGTAAFLGCAELELVDGFDEVIIQIGDSAFKNCTKLRSVEYTHSSGAVLPKYLQVIGAEAFMNTSLEKIYLLEEVSQIEDNVFSGCEDILTIYCYPYTYATSYAVSNRLNYELLEETESTSFKMGKDSWSFKNNGFNFTGLDEVTRERLPRFINPNDLERLLIGADNQQREIIDFWVKNGMTGMCRGMSAAAVLVKMGLLLPSDFETGAEKLYDVSTPKGKKAESLLNYYHLAQDLYNAQADCREFQRLSFNERMKRIDSLAEAANNGGPPFLLNFGAHAVVCYGVKHSGLYGGKYLRKGKFYDSKLLIYDPNRPEREAGFFYSLDESQVYWDGQGYETLAQATNDPSILAPSPRGAVTFYSIYSDRLSEYWMYCGDKKYWIYPEINNGEIIALHGSDGVNTNNECIITIPINESEYVITPPASDCDFMIALEDALIGVDCANASKLVFHPNGSFTVGDVSGNYDLTLLFNEGHYSTPWYKTNIQGTGSGDITMSQTEDGILVKGTDHGTVTVTVTDVSGNEQQLSYRTDEDQVLLTSMPIEGQEVPVVLTDEDEDGTYEHLISAGTAIHLLKLDREYSVLAKDEELPMTCSVIPAELAEYVKWTVELADETPDNPAEVLTVDEKTGLVTAKNPGTAYVVASVEMEGEKISARCRIDVVEGEEGSTTPIADDVGKTDEKGVEVNGVHLVDTKATTEVFRTDYTRITVVPVLTQNEAGFQSIVIPQGEPEEGNGAAIESATFTETEADRLFALRVVDDRTLEIVPRDETLYTAAGENLDEKANSIKGSYKSTINVVIEGKLFTTTEQLTLNVKKTMPKLKAAAVKFNSFLPNDRAELEVTVTNGGTVQGYTLADTTDGRPAEVPDFVDISELEQGILKLQSGGAKSGKLWVKCWLDDWAVTQAIQIPVSQAMTKPSLTVKPSSLTLTPNSNDSASALISIKPDTLANLPVAVTQVREGSGKDAKAYSVATDGTAWNSDVLAGRYENGMLTVWLAEHSTADYTAAHTYSLALSIGEGANTVEKAVTVKTLKTPENSTAVTMTAKAAGGIDTELAGSPVTLTLALKNYHGTPDEVSFYPTVMQTPAKTKDNPTPASVPVKEGLFDIIPTAGTPNVFLITLSDTEEAKAEVESLIEEKTAFSVAVSADIGAKTTGSDGMEEELLIEAKPVPLSVKRSAKAPQSSMSIAQKGAIDVIRPTTAITLTPTVKNCYLYEPRPEDVTITATHKQNGIMATEAWEDNLENRFRVNVEDGHYIITAAAGAELDHTWTYSAAVKAEAAGLEATVKKLAIRMGAAKVEQSAKEIQLLMRDRYSEGRISLIPADGQLSGISRVAFADSNDRISKDGFFDLTEIGGGTWSIGYAGNEITTTKNTTVKLNVFFRGNLTSKPNATVSIKIIFA